MVVVPTQRSGVDILSWGELVVVLGSLPSLKDQVISLNPSSWGCLLLINLPWGSNTQAKTVCWLRAMKVGVVTTIVIDGVTRGLEHPRKVMAQEEPWGQALCILPMPYTPSAFQSTSSSSMVPLVGITFFHGEGGCLLRTSLLVKVVLGLISSLSPLRHSASCHLSWALDS